jgi:hypothetical protein
MADLTEFARKPSTNPTLWRDGKMPALQSEFLEWLLTPRSEREEKSQVDWAARHGVASTTLTDWKKDRRFRREWENRADARNIGVDRIQGVLDTLHEAAVAGDVQAAKLWLQEVDKLRPPKQAVADKELELLSDEDLDALLDET